MLNKEGKNIVITVADVMTSPPVTIGADIQLEKLIELFNDKNYNGIPVVDAEGKLLGIVTQYDLVTKGSGMHIPTLVKTLEDVKMVEQEKLVLEGTLAPIKKLKARDMMNPDALSLKASAPVEEAVQQFAEHHKVNPIVVVDDSNKVVGVLSRHDIIKILAAKELGRAIGAAVERTDREGGADIAVAGAMKSVKKEFFFMPKYGAGKWIVMGVAVFIVGLVASFLFIVKVPDNSQVDQTVVSAPEGEAALYMRLSPGERRVGQIFSVDIFARFSGTANKISTIFSDISFDAGQQFVGLADSASSTEFVSGVQLLNLKNNQINSIWIPATTTFSPELEKNYYLGSFEFKALKPGINDIKFNLGAPGSMTGSYVKDIFGRSILKDATGLEVKIN